VLPDGSIGWIRQLTVMRWRDARTNARIYRRGRATKHLKLNRYSCHVKADLCFSTTIARLFLTRPVGRV